MAMARWKKTAKYQVNGCWGGWVRRAASGNAYKGLRPRTAEGQNKSD